MTDYLTPTIARVVLMQQACITLPDGSAPMASPRWLYKQNTMPYWVNQPGRFTAEREAVDLERRDHTIVMRLVLGSQTSDYAGAHEDRLYAWIPGVLDYFNRRPRLRRTVDDDQIAFLHPEYGAFCESGTGVQLHPVTGRIICDFILTVPFLIPVAHVF
jgi:hypothetical protein